MKYPGAETYQLSTHVEQYPRSDNDHRNFWRFMPKCDEMPPDCLIAHSQAAVAMVRLPAQWWIKGA
jgi:hypothetical protein